MESEKEYIGMERRRNIRWNQLISSGFKMVNDIREVTMGKWRSSVIHNISAGGVSLEVKEINEEWKDELVSGRMKVLLEIRLPEIKKPIIAMAKVIWLSKLWKEEDERGKYLLGLNFTDITNSGRDAIIEYILNLYAKDSE